MIYNSGEAMEVVTYN